MSTLASQLQDHEAPAPATPGATLPRLLRYARPYLWLFGLSIVLAALLSAAQLGRAYLVKPAADEIIGPALQLRGSAELGAMLPSLPFLEQEPAEAPLSQEEAVAVDAEVRAKLADIVDSAGRILVAATLIILAMPLLLFAREYTVQYVLGRIDMDMKVDVCGKLLVLPMRFHQQRQRGDILQRILGDARLAHQALDLALRDLLQAVVMVVLGFGALFWISWQLTLLLCLMGPAIVLVITGLGRRIRRSAHRRQEQSAEVTQRLVEILAGIKIVKVFRAEATEHEAFRRAARRLFRHTMKVVKNRQIARSLIEAINTFAGIGVAILGCLLVIGGYWGLTPGDLVAFVLMIVTVYEPIRAVAKGWVKVIDAAPSAERFFEVIDSDVEIRDAEDAVAIGRVTSAVVFDDVSFSYGREPVLERVSFEARAGEVVAIVGRTGSGKTTLTDLLLRLYEPDGGRILVDGTPLGQIQRDSMLDQIAVVTQDPFLFDATLGDNIRYGRADATDEQVRAAARAAHVEEFVAELPEGYDTRVGGSGSLLSGGQRQRVTIARAILRDPSILILDEATSSLDSKSERFVQQALEALMSDRTVFVIAHRLSTIRSADKILVLEDGRISECGTHAELVAASGLYRELVAIQTESNATAADQRAAIPS